MNDTQNPQEVNEMTPDEAAASLAMATRMSEEMMTQNAPQQPKTAPGGEETPEAKEDVATMIKAEVAKSIKEEMGGLRKELKEMLDEQD